MFATVKLSIGHPKLSNCDQKRRPSWSGLAISCASPENGGAGQFCDRLAAGAKTGLNKTIVDIEHPCSNDWPVKMFRSAPCRQCPGQSGIGAGSLEYSFLKAACVGRHRPRVGCVGVRQNAAACWGYEREPRRHGFERGDTEGLPRIWVNEHITTGIQASERRFVGHMTEKNEPGSRSPRQFCGKPRSHGPLPRDDEAVVDL